MEVLKMLNNWSLERAGPGAALGSSQSVYGLSSTSSLSCSPFSLSYSRPRLSASPCTFLQEEYDCLSPSPTIVVPGTIILLGKITLNKHCHLWLGPPSPFITGCDWALVKQDIPGPQMHTPHSHFFPSYLVLHFNLLPINWYIIFFFVIPI